MNKKITYGLLAGVAAVALVALLNVSGLLARWENPTADWRARLLARPSPATEQIKLILLDQYSLDWASQNLGWSWPWPREAYAVVLDYLKRCGAKTAIFDVLYTEPSAFGVADDEALGAAVERFGSFVGAVFLGQTTAQTTTWPDTAKPNAFVVNGLDAWLNAHPAAATEMVATAAAFPVPELTRATAWLANVREIPDEDGVFRRAIPFRMFDGQVLPSLGFAGWLAGLEPPVASATLTADELHVAGLKVPLDASGRLILKFRGPSGTHQAFNAVEVIQSELRLLEGGSPPLTDDSIFKDKWVVFGFSAPGLKDLRPTPIAPDYPGPEIYATMLDNMLAGDFLREASPVAAWAWIFALALLAAVIASVARSGWHSGLTALILLPLPTIAAAGLASGIVWPVAGASVHAAGTARRRNRQLCPRRPPKTFIKCANHYLSAEVIEQIVRDPNSLKLGGERRELTIFFSDLEGFSSFSEKLSPEELTKLLNDYLTDMTDIIMDEGGTLDKYVGDAIVAFWNAPLPQVDHAARAVRAAVRCQRRLAERREEYMQRTGVQCVAHRPEHRAGGGRQHGPPAADYTMLGDAANLASRLEGANKALGTYTMVAESTWALTQNAFPGRELGQLRVVGRSTPVRVFEPLGLAGEPPSSISAPFAAALALAQARRWAEAAQAFTAIATDDPVAKKYATNCDALAAAGPNATWDGVWSLTEK